MKRYIKQILISLGAMGAFFLMCFFLNRYLETQMTLDLEGDILIMGESHVRAGLDPKFIDGSVNVAQPAETTFLTYHKLKKIIEKTNKQFERVLLGIGHNTISGINDIKYTDDQYAYEFILRSYTLMGREKLKEVSYDWRTYIKVILKQMLLFPHANHDTYIGDFFPRVANFENSTAETQINKHYYDAHDKRFPISDQSITYLDSIIDFCASNSIDLTLIYMPHHEDYLEALPDDVVSRFDRMIANIELSGARWIDLRNLKIADSDFANHDHLSAAGAERVSRHINSELSKEGGS